MTYSIKHLFHIAAPQAKVYEAISGKDGLSNWWTSQVSGQPEIGGILQFRFGGGGPDMKVTGAQANDSLSWECTSGPEGWIGNQISFQLDENDGKTRVRFSHDGWKQQDDFYANSCFSWGRYMESLRQYCQTGQGQGFGTEGYRK